MAITNVDNNFVTVDNPGAYVSKHAGVGFYSNMLLLDLVDTQYSAEFGTKVGGAMVGNSIEIRFPARFVETEQIEMDDTTINTIDELTKRLTLTQDIGIHANVSIKEVTLEIEAGGTGYAERVLQPMGKQLSAAIEKRGFDAIALKAQNVTVIESYGGTDAEAVALRKAIVKMRSKLDKQSAPAGDRFTVLSSDLEVDIANEQLFMFHSKPEIEKAYKEGTMNHFGGLRWHASDLVKSRTNGAGGTAGLVVGSYTSGATTMVITGIEAAGAVVGDKLSFTGNNLVNAQTREGYAGTPITRAILAISDDASDTVTIDPIYGPENGVNQNAEALPVATDAVAVLGTSGEDYLCIPVFQKLGVTCASVDMYLPKNVEMSSRNKVGGVAQQFVRAYDIVKRRLLSRYECLIQWDLVRPEWVGVVEVNIA